MFILLTIIQCLLISPVRPLFYVLKMWVLLTQACIKHCHLHTRTCKHTKSSNLFYSKQKDLPKTMSHPVHRTQMQKGTLCLSMRRHRFWRQGWHNIAFSRKNSSIENFGQISLEISVCLSKNLNDELLTSMSHLPEYVCLQDLGNMAGDGSQQAPAWVATGGVPETRAQRQTGSSERTGWLPRLPFWRCLGGIAGCSRFRCYRETCKQCVSRPNCANSPLLLQ